MDIFVQRFVTTSDPSPGGSPRSRVRLSFFALACLVLAGILLGSFSPAANALRPLGLPRDRYAVLLPQFCQRTHSWDLIDPNPVPRSTPSRAHFDAIIGVENMKHLHHYCQGLAYLIDVKFRILPQIEKERYWQSTLAEFRYAIERLTPDCILWPEILTKNGETLLNLGKPIDAINDFRQAIAKKADYWPAYAGLARTYERIGKRSEALATLDEGLKQSPGAKQLQIMRAELTKGSGAQNTPPSSVASRDKVRATKADSKQETAEESTGAASAGDNATR